MREHEWRSSNGSEYQCAGCGAEVTGGSGVRLESDCPGGLSETRSETIRGLGLPVSLRRRSRVEDQPPPKPNAGQSILRLVMADLAERERLGIERYGAPLQAHNGRDALVDAYQEALDLAAYLRQVIEERGSGLSSTSGAVSGDAAESARLRELLDSTIAQLHRTQAERDALRSGSGAQRIVFRDGRSVGWRTAGGGRLGVTCNTTEEARSLERYLRGA